MKIKQIGFTLIELLVSMTISSLLMLGLIQIYTDTLKVQRYQDKQIISIDNIRFVDMVFKKYIDKAGFRLDSSQILGGLDANIAIEGCGVFLEGEFVTIYNSKANGANGFCIRYQPATLNGSFISKEVDCAGKARSSGLNKFGIVDVSSVKTVVLAIFFERGKTLQEGVLKCQTSYDSGDNKDKSNEVEIFDGVADFRIGIINRKGKVLYNDITKGYSRDDSNQFVGIQYNFLFASEPMVRVRGTRGYSKSVIKDRWIQKYTESAQYIQSKDDGNLFSILDGIALFKNVTKDIKSSN